MATGRLSARLTMLLLRKTRPLSSIGVSYFVAYPNPTREYVIVEHPATAGRAHVKLIDIVGRVVKTIRVNNNVLQTTVSLKEVPVGSYQISWSDGIRLLTKTVIVE